MKCMSLVVGEERVEGGGGGGKGGCWGELELQRTPEFTFLLLGAGEITQGRETTERLSSNLRPTFSELTLFCPHVDEADRFTFREQRIEPTVSEKI